MGDLIEFIVPFAVRVDGIIVIPHGTLVNAKVLERTAPRRGSKDAVLNLAFEEFELPSGESATVRVIRKPPTTGQKTVGEAIEGVNDALGILFFGQYFSKGREWVVVPGAIGVVYLDGPLRISRKAAVQAQPAPGTRYAWVVASNLAYLACGQRFMPEIRSGEILQLKLNPGNYWFSTDAYTGKWNVKPHMKKARVNLAEDHEYEVKLDKHSELVVTELDDRNLYGHLTTLDLTGLTAEENRLLAAESIIKPHLSAR